MGVDHGISGMETPPTVILSYDETGRKPGERRTNVVWSVAWLERRGTNLNLQLPPNSSLFMLIRGEGSVWDEKGWFCSSNERPE